MSWIPEFNIGWWNAWILMLIFPTHTIILNIIDKMIGTGDIYQKMGDAPSSESAKRAELIPTLLLFILFIVSIFLPLKLGTVWFYLGLLIYLAGLVILLSALITVVRTPLGHVFFEGIYRYSRHPLYLSFLIMFVGVSIASASWVMFGLSLVWMIFPAYQVIAEERKCLEIFGTEYQEYMDKTHRWLGLPKSR